MTSLESIDILSFRGWLVKKKNLAGGRLISSDAKRWFQLQEVDSVGSAYNKTELALCYYKSINEVDARGIFYLKDIREISDDKKMITIISSSRNLELVAKNQFEHVFWLQGLVTLCPGAVIERLSSKSYMMYPMFDWFQPH